MLGAGIAVTDLGNKKPGHATAYIDVILQCTGYEI